MNHKVFPEQQTSLRLVDEGEKLAEIIPPISCENAGTLWTKFQSGEEMTKEEAFLLLGHLADEVGTHEEACVISEETLAALRAYCWPEGADPS